MLRTRSHWLVAGLIASSVLTSTAVYAQTPTPPPAPHEPGAGHHGPLGRLQRKLGLTDDQVNQMRAVFQAQRPAQKQLWQSMRQAQGNLRQLALNGGDASALASAKAQVAQLLAQGVDLRVQTLQQVAPILTPDQRTQFAAMDPAMMGRGRHHHRGPKPPQS